MKTCVIMQPTYLPWSGYFNLMAHSDAFVFLDDVQFSRRSWQTRNRILLNGNEVMLTVPVLSSERDQTRIRDVRLASGSWLRKHRASLTQAYSNAAYGRELLAIIGAAYETDESVTHLSTFNQKLIVLLARALAIDTPLLNASDLACSGHRSEHLLNICLALGCDEYLSPVGSADYLTEDDFSSNGRVSLRFQSYVPAPYPQPKTKTFISHLSVIDVIAHHGLEFASQYVRSSLS